MDNNYRARVHDLVTGEDSRVVSTSDTGIGCANPLMFSPDGKELLLDTSCEGIGNWANLERTVGDGHNPRALTLTGHQLLRVRWDASGLMALTRGDDGIYLEDLIGQTSKRLWGEDYHALGSQYSWGDAGHLFQLKHDGCTTEAIERCGVEMFHIVFRSISNGADERTVARGLESGERVTSLIVMDPGGKRFVWISEGELFTHDL